MRSHLAIVGKFDLMRRAIGQMRAHLAKRCAFGQMRCAFIQMPAHFSKDRCYSHDGRV